MDIDMNNESVRRAIRFLLKHLVSEITEMAENAKSVQEDPRQGDNCLKPEQDYRLVPTEYTELL